MTDNHVLLTWVFIGKSSEEDRWVNVLLSWAAGPGSLPVPGPGAPGVKVGSLTKGAHVGTYAWALPVASTFICSPGSVRSLESGRGRIKARCWSKGCHLLEDVRHGNRNLWAAGEWRPPGVGNAQYALFGTLCFGGRATRFQ